MWNTTLGPTTAVENVELLRRMHWPIREQGQWMASLPRGWF